jgi:hypothetical protein
LPHRLLINKGLALTEHWQYKLWSAANNRENPLANSKKSSKDTPDFSMTIALPSIMTIALPSMTIAQRAKRKPCREVDSASMVCTGEFIWLDWSSGEKA